ncbi:bifunctional purine biosynthesis protein [Candidatus Photodesmus blepharus]|uniref:Bifunctional purine biosynthesis protein n=1 Tax=Candidatus Photodesmus blepharonis TaxID=1179155 RepID=A0A084CN98_9GAMM|nr:1-acyl-sn-glycerol-3-phosphate acyltransferase [Candidatus Photodesmus blepharus]KEY91277.1 bifunctional purine biosynthesis protein [Candidatus Photodesmus blepharus]
MSNDSFRYLEISPYSDEEIPSAVNRLLNDKEFIYAILQHRFSNYVIRFKVVAIPLLRFYLKFKWAKLTSVKAVQMEVKKHLVRMLESTTDGVTFTGLDKLDRNVAYLFVSNHRDIAMDPALVNYVLHQSKHNTVRIAVGDNLLKKPCAVELMKLNKSFIVKRSVKAPREMMRALSTLSGYIKHSLDTGNSIWIAQREGRAKDGNDFTDPAILKMFYVEGRRLKVSFRDYIRSLRIVPVAISYENDPCDISKASELHKRERNGSYEKGESEDIESIVQGIVGDKGRVHVSFGDVIAQDFETPDELAFEIDRQVHNIYKIFPMNQLAAGHEEGIEESVRLKLKKKLEVLPKEAHKYLLDSYANPVRNQASLKF